MDDKDKILIGLYLVDQVIETAKLKEELQKKKDEAERNWKWYSDKNNEFIKLSKNEDVKQIIENLKAK